MRELSALLQTAPFDLVSLADVGIVEEVEETGETFEQNATLKAETYARLSGLATLADDSGLEVDALGGEPGVRSARYAGEDASDEEKIAFLIGKLDNTVNVTWTARFRCVVAVAWPDRPTHLYQGTCEGIVVREPRGANGFGYDPVFFIPKMDMTMAELTAEQKNRISHRSIATKKAATELNNPG